MRQIIYFTSIVLLLTLIWQCQPDERPRPLVHYTVQKDSAAYLIESGTIQSSMETSIMTPSNWRMDYRIQYLPDEGQYVHAGDTVVIFDTRQVQSRLDEAEAKYQIQQAELEETIENNKNQLKQKKERVQQLEYELQLAKTRLENARFESDLRQKEMALALKKTELRLQEAKKNVEAQRSLNAYKRNIVALKMKQAEVDIQRARLMMEDMFITAPRAGMIIYAETRGGEKIKVGESMRPQSNILSIPDLDKMKAVINLNEVDRPFVNEDMKATITIDAYPDSVFRGQISSVSRIVDNHPMYSNLKTYAIHVAINGGGNYRLIPGLSCRIKIKIKTIDDGYSIPSWCLSEHDQQYFVETKENERIPVEIVLLNSGRAFIQGAIDETTQLKANTQNQNH
ncbi:MAG: HlyD family efflux transporter periplasmic adaptor subunit [Caldithrix sp.]|nr:HlyD family efflux transporter periplasmic adaptor subunit [Caldithrix sp.]